MPELAECRAFIQAKLDRAKRIQKTKLKRENNIRKDSSRLASSAIGGSKAVLRKKRIARINRAKA